MWIFFDSVHFFVITWCTVVICKLKGWHILFGFWVALVLQPVGSQLALWTYEAGYDYIPWHPVDWLAPSRYVGSATLPLAAAMVLPRSDVIRQLFAARRRSVPARKQSTAQMHIRTFLVTSIATAVLFWILYPLDFLSPHRFVLDLGDWRWYGIYDTYYSLSVTYRSVSGAVIHSTMLNLPFFSCKLPIPALACLLILATLALGGFYFWGEVCTYWRELKRSADNQFQSARGE